MSTSASFLAELTAGKNMTESAAEPAGCRLLTAEQNWQNMTRNWPECVPRCSNRTMPENSPCICARSSGDLNIDVACTVAGHRMLDHSNINSISIASPTTLMHSCILAAGTGSGTSQSAPRLPLTNTAASCRCYQSVDIMSLCPCAEHEFLVF